MKISCFLTQKWQAEILKKEFQDSTLKIFSEPLNKVNINQIKDTEILVSRARFLDLKFDKNTLSQLPDLKLIATMSTGFDHIDLDYCKEKNILVSNVPIYGEDCVSEHAFTLILSLSKKIPQSIQSLKNKSINPEKLQGFDLKGKTIGVVGSGKIGLNVLKVAKALGMNLQSFDIIHNNDAAKEIGFEYVTLEHLLKTSDIISLHIPDNKHTHHMINKTNLPLMKPNAMIINTARGGIIDTPELVKFLKDNPEASAGLDVYEGESDDLTKLSPDVEKLLRMDNVILTGHNASNTKEAKGKILETTVSNIKGFIGGKAENLVEEIKL